MIMTNTNLYAYDDILFTDIKGGNEPHYIYANPTIYDMGNNYMVVINEENSQLELIDKSSGLFKSIYVCNDTELISHIENILEFYIKNKEQKDKAEAFYRIVKTSKETLSCGDFCDDVSHIINSYEIGVAKDE